MSNYYIPDAHCAVCGREVINEDPSYSHSVSVIKCANKKCRHHVGVKVRHEDKYPGWVIQEVSEVKG